MKCPQMELLIYFCLALYYHLFRLLLQLITLDCVFQIESGLSGRLSIV